MKRPTTPAMSPELVRTIYGEFFADELSKSDRRKIAIIDGAIKAYADIDFSAVSFDEIGASVKTSRRLVQHYFPEKEDLFLIAMKSIRAQFQLLAVESFSKAETPSERFEAYVLSTFEWVSAQPVHVRAWFLFFVVCSKNEKMRAVHAELTKMGEERIIALIKELDPKRKRSPETLKAIAKSVQRLITGGIIEACSEREKSELKLVSGQTLRACWAVLDM